MKAIEVVKPGSIEIIEKEMPRISRPDEVRIKVRMAGICGSDMHIYHGTSPVATYPRVSRITFAIRQISRGYRVDEQREADHRFFCNPLLFRSGYRSGDRAY